MKTTALALMVLASSVILRPTAAAAQITQRPGDKTSQSSASIAPQSTTSSNAWDTLPEMSADRCLAEAIGTGSNPKTGAPEAASVDPKTGKRLCPPGQLNTESKPTR